MRTIHFIRHGESEWHSQNKYAGHTDIDLTAEGITQAISLIPWSKEIQPSLVYSSDLQRAVKTARPMAEFLGVNQTIDPRLREVNFGEIEGLTPEEMTTKYPNLRKEFLIKPADTQMPGGESGRIALTRSLPVIIEIMNLQVEGDAVIVCHGTIMRLIACKMLGIEINEYRRFFPKVLNGGKISLRAEISEADRCRFSRVEMV